MALPNFLCVGAEKAGTTALHLLLRQHPDIFVPPRKETHFFSRATAPPALRFYETTHFRNYNGESAIGEMTPDYMRVPNNARRLREALGLIRIIICLREPLRRAFSHYWHCLRLLEEERPFAVACEQEAQASSGLENHLAIRRSYLRGSWYPAPIKEFVREFGQENVFFIVLERDLADDFSKRRMLKRLLDFLELDAGPLQGMDLKIRNTSLPCPSIYIVPEGAPRTIVSPEGRDMRLEEGDIVFSTGNQNLNRVIRRPSIELRHFFRAMAENMTRVLSHEAQQRLRTLYFTRIAEQTSELVNVNLAVFW